MFGKAHQIETRYFSDPTFHKFVDTLVAITLDKGWTARDFNDAMQAAEVRVLEERLATGGERSDG